MVEKIIITVKKTRLDNPEVVETDVCVISDGWSVTKFETLKSLEGAIRGFKQKGIHFIHKKSNADTILRPYKAGTPKEEIFREEMNTIDYLKKQLKKKMDIKVYVERNDDPNYKLG